MCKIQGRQAPYSLELYYLDITQEQPDTTVYCLSTHSGWIEAHFMHFHGSCSYYAAGMQAVGMNIAKLFQKTIVITVEWLATANKQASAKIRNF